MNKYLFNKLPQQPFLHIAHYKKTGLLIHFNVVRFPGGGKLTVDTYSFKIALPAINFILKQT